MSDKKIIICDDDKGIVDMLETILEMEGFQVITQTNSLHVYDDIVKEQANILVIDLWMPIISGDLVIKRVKENKSLEDLYVICISASQDGDEIALDAGADMFLAKPFDIYTLLDHIMREVSE